jgi:hypothetical protein
MYRLYCESTDEPVKKGIYREIFNTAFNLAFHRPKKDFCKLCTTYNNSSSDEKAVIQQDYDMHHSRKNRVRAIKEESKKLAKSNLNLVAVTFDLQQVLSTPKLDVSSLFYKRKLSTYDLTVYNLADSSAQCYMWHEGVAGRGSN